MPAYYPVIAKVFFIHPNIQDLYIWDSPRGPLCGYLGFYRLPEAHLVWPPEPPFSKRLTGVNPGNVVVFPELHTETSASH